MAQVLVTGATGWIGGRLVPELLRAGHDVRSLVEPGVEPGPIVPDVEVVRGDVRDPTAVAAAVEAVETVVHCAAVIHPARARDFYAINVAGTQRVVEAAARAGVRRLVHVSSNAAAGFQRERRALLAEDDLPVPKGGYGKSKLEAELAVLAAHDDGRFETVVIRPCRCYGPGQPARVQRVFEMIARGRVPVFGDGRALRSMSYVDDVASVLAQCVDDPAASGEMLWIADERPYTTLGAFDAMATAAGVPLRIRHLPKAAARVCEKLDLIYEHFGGYSMSLHLIGESHHDIGCSIEKAKRVLGFRPKNDLVEGYREALEQSRREPLFVSA
jgi:nucleoside-diphosphate-sugar epimerase